MATAVHDMLDEGVQTPSMQEGFGQGSMVYPAHLHGKYC